MSIWVNFIFHYLSNRKIKPECDSSTSRRKNDFAILFFYLEVNCGPKSVHGWQVDIEWTELTGCCAKI